ncbi:MAG TPA: hypothetical protein VM285_10845 [Polyangia bacterium]|nr:hypothetical protein [Polyangia bacterium]HUV09362.1 hypothetical protein [Acidimicrobiia bacterium]
MKFQADKLIQVVHAIDAKNHTATVSSATIDTRGFDECLVILNKGTAGTTASGTAFVMESDSTTAASFAHISGSSFTAVTPTAATKASEIVSIDLRGKKRYLRVKYSTATANAIYVAADVILLAYKTPPVSASATLKARV